MKIAVMGAGAVGSYFGALLARAGEAVTLVGRPAHVDAIRERGLLLETNSLRAFVDLSATTAAAGVSGADVVLFCVKSGDTEAVGREIAPHLSPQATILSLQNGVDNAERLTGLLSRDVIPAAVYVATEMAGPGHVRHHGRGELIVGPSPASERIAVAFRAAGIPTDVSENTLTALWSKLVINCAYNALSAIAEQSYGQMMRTAGIAEVMSDVVAECTAVARATGIHLPEDIGATVLALADAMPRQFSSTAQDLARGRASEIDHLNGYIVRRGEELRIATPANRVLHTLVKLVEAKGSATL
ncbi:ketopantoate reductase family protein [Methylobacterium durans]|uniref:2-dehydropantoate 2-reductase n=1 Tax=Methylobacterium durans TaxID=2202825 RepID=A0A2U8WDU3_9HYPH|nr:2-dehydropantoate 2-reductase [Methylobacterium durans]AWN44374.1 2-dehydropantoate 2-reductase [Methylobacterium durans]